VFDAIMEFHPEHIREKVTAAEKAVYERVLQRPRDPMRFLPSEMQ
jgi:hypothetical protein